MYRVLAANAEVRERRNQLRHPAYHKPELLATGPNQVWSWDITKLLGPVKWTYYYLYVLLDIFSRYVVGWLLARQESRRPGQGADRRELRAPAHRARPAHHPCRPRPVDDLAAGGPAAGDPGRGALALPAPRLRRQPLLRGAVQDPQVPAGLPGSLRRLRGCRDVLPRFFPWYNLEHRHGALGLMTPHDMHYGLAAAKWQQRAAVLRAAYAAHPERFPRGVPVPPPLPTAAWINKPPAPPALAVPEGVGS